MIKRESWDERAYDAFQAWHNRAVRKLDPHDYRFEANNPTTNVERLGVRMRTSVHFGTLKLSGGVFSRFGNSPRALSADVFVTGDSHTKLITDMQKHVLKKTPRVLEGSRAMYARFIFAVTVDSLLAYAIRVRDEYTRNQLRLTGRKILLEGATLSERIGNEAVDKQWLADTARSISGDIDLATARNIIRQFVNDPPLAKDNA